MHDVTPAQYTAVIRDLIRHENDLTNHRLMWMLLGQGLVANAYVIADTRRSGILSMLPPVGILVAFSAFVILYKSYQARGYLAFLGGLAKRGDLREENLPLVGWPEKRIKGWRRNVWLCPWLGRLSDLIEPYLFLPSLFLVVWLFVLLRDSLHVRNATLLLLCTTLAALFLSTFCLLWVQSQSKDELDPH